MEIAVEGNLKTTSSPEVTKSTDPTKRPTFAEKLMGIKNTQCDQHLVKAQQKIHQNRSRNMQRIREETNRISYDFKEIKVNQKKRELEIKKKQNPYLDTEQDEFDIMRAEKYMVFNPNICFYTNKKNQIPIRSQAKLDPFHVTATVSKARKILQDMTTEKHVQNMKERRALMHSRKSAHSHSVRFQVRDSSDEDNQNYGKHNKFRSPSPGKSYIRYPTPSSGRSPSPTGLKTTKPRVYTPQCPTVEASEVPDDFTQYASRHVQAYMKMANSSSETGTDFHLPSMTSQQRTQTYLNSRPGEEDVVTFKDLEKDVPPHEVQLLKEASEVVGQRPSKSAIVRRTPSQLSYYNKRNASASTASMKRRQYTHSAMRRENKDVEMKVQGFLKSFDKTKKKRFYQHAMHTSTDGNQTVSFDIPDGETKDTNPDQIKRPVSEAAIKNNFEGKEDSDQVSHFTRAKSAMPMQNGEFSHSAMTGRVFYGAQLESQTKPKRKTGIPHHSQERSKRHTATFKLRKVVEELIKNRTTHQILEAEKMKLKGGEMKTPEPDRDIDS